MAFPAAAGVPSHSGVMVPEIWSGKMLVKFYEASVFGSIANTDYENEIKEMGDVVHIRTTPSIVIRDYVKGQKLTHEQPEPGKVDLLIDRGKYWSFVSDDVTKAQADYAYVEDWTKDASEQLKINIDTGILADIYADTHAANTGATAGVRTGNINLGVTGTPLLLDKTNIIDEIVNWGTVLDEQNAPESGRYVVLPPWACNRIKRSDLKDASLSGDGTSMLRNGRVGMIDRFEIFMSNLLSVVSDGGNNCTHLLFGHKTALTFASQLVKNEGPMRDADYFGDYFRGLQIYGYEVIKKESLGHAYARPT